MVSTWRACRRGRCIIDNGAHWNQFPKHENEPLKLCFPEGKIAYMKAGKYTPPKEFLLFIDSSFTEILNRQSDYIIIDITEGGGFTILTDSFISYITDHSFCNLEKKMIRLSRSNQFRGKVFILAGPRTYSASSRLTAIAKCYTDAYRE